MLTYALSALALVSCHADVRQEAKPVDLKIEQAIVYQTGLVMLTRSAPVDQGRRRYKVTVVPEAAEGSLWYGVAEGATVGDVITRLRFAPRTETFTLQTPAQLIAANVGKKVRFSLIAYTGSTPKKEFLEGVLEYVRPPNENQAGIRLSNGLLRSFNPVSVTELDTRGLTTSVEVKTRVPERTMEIEIEAEKPSALWILSLERGASWAGSYAIETKADTTAAFLYKLQVALGALKFEHSEVKLLAGSPRLPSTIRTDLASGASSFAALFGSSPRQPDVFNALRDPYEEIGRVLRERERIIAEATFAAYARAYSGYGGGGMGGGGFGGGGMDFMSYDPSDNSIVNRPDFERTKYQPNPGVPEELLDLISYPMGRLSLEPGDRMSRVQQKKTLKAEPVVQWNLAFRPDPNYTGSIGRFLRLHNDSAMFWAPGPCLISHLGTPVALSSMPLTGPQANAYVRVDDSEAILHARQVKEISREPINFPSSRFAITAEFTFTLGNTTSQAIEFEVVQDIEGRVLDAPDAEVRAVNPFSIPNPIYRVEWRMNLAPGEKKEFKLKYVHRQI